MKRSCGFSGVAWLCLSLSLFGVLLVAFFVRQMHSSNFSLFGQRGDFFVDRLVFVSGSVARVYEYDSSYKLLLCGKGCVSVWFSKNRVFHGLPSDFPAFSKGRVVAVEGVLRDNGEGVFLVPLDEDSVEVLR